MTTFRTTVFTVAVLVSMTMAGCGGRSCGSAENNQVDRLILQLQGGCCQYHTDPTDEQIDNSCKSLSTSWFLPVRIYSDYSCAMWAAECIGQMGEEAAPAIPALIEAVRDGPNNYDTGDGVIPTRNKIVQALGSIGDERALQPLLEALDNPRPVDAGPGAVGYASEEPQGEAAALEALGLLGPLAQSAVPKIIPFLSRPIEDSRDERVVRATARSLGEIQDTAAIPALIGALSDPVRAPFVARALGEFGLKAEEAAPALIRLIEDSPDLNGNFQIRGAIRDIRGKEALETLPKSYDGMTSELRRLVQRIAKQRQVKLRRIHVDGPRDEIAVDLESGHRIHFTFNREDWIDRRVVTGEMIVESNGSEDSRERYAGIGEVESQFAQALDRHTPQTQ